MKIRYGQRISRSTIPNGEGFNALPVSFNTIAIASPKGEAISNTVPEIASSDFVLLAMTVDTR